MSRQKRDILEFFPYAEPRLQQKEVLLAIQEYWNRYDVFVIVAPTAAGKASLAKTIAAWRYNAAIITPTNILVSQYVSEFPDTQKLFKREMYKCPRFANGLMTCADAHAKYKKKLGCSTECEYIFDNRRARGRGHIVCNYYTYMANKLFKPTLIIDEGHNALRVLQDLSGQKLWRHDYHYPWDMWTSADILHWLEHKDGAAEDELLKGLKEEITSSTPRYIIKRGYDMWNMTSVPEERELLTMLPIDVRDAPPFLWPATVQKLVFLSATISYKDIESMGLDRRKILYLEVDSPIPKERRPIEKDYVSEVKRGNLKEATEVMAKKIRQEYLPRHEGQKGVIHATYAQAKILREHLAGNESFLFHDRTNTKQQYQKFLDSPASSGTVFVASGLYEGIDLVEDLGRWQILTKVPWPNLGDPAIKYKAEQDRSWYIWQTLRDVMQCCGRICRTPTDFGMTYIMDQSFERLVKQGLEFNLIPNWWKEVINEN